MANPAAVGIDVRVAKGPYKNATGMVIQIIDETTVLVRMTHLLFYKFDVSDLVRIQPKRGWDDVSWDGTKILTESSEQHAER